MKIREKTAEAKAKMWTTLIEVMVCIASIYVASSVDARSHTNSILGDYASILIVGSIMLLLGEFSYRIFLLAFKDQEKREESINLVDERLSTKTYINVVPIATLYEEDFMISLISKAQFYAILSEEYEDQVNIFIKFNNEETPILFDKLYRDCFRDCYKITES